MAFVSLTLGKTSFPQISLDGLFQHKKNLAEIIADRMSVSNSRLAAQDSHLPFFDENGDDHVEVHLSLKWTSRSLEQALLLPVAMIGT